jgi:hypothetical protein
MMAKRSSSLTADYILAMIGSTLKTRVTMFPSWLHFLGAGWSLAAVVSGFATVTTATAAYVLLDVTTSCTRLHPMDTWGLDSCFLFCKDLPLNRCSLSFGNKRKFKGDFRRVRDGLSGFLLPSNGDGSKLRTASPFLQVFREGRNIF